MLVMKFLGAKLILLTNQSNSHIIFAGVAQDYVSSKAGYGSANIMGYIPSDLTAELAPIMDAGRDFDAEFVCINECPPHELVGLTVRIVETTINWK